MNLLYFVEEKKSVTLICFFLGGEKYCLVEEFG